MSLEDYLIKKYPRGYCDRKECMSELLMDSIPLRIAKCQSRKIPIYKIVRYLEDEN